MTISNARFDGIGFKLDLSDIIPATIDVYDAGGRRVASGRTSGSRSPRVVPRNAVSNGIYIVRVSMGTVSAYAKVSVAR